MALERLYHPSSHEQILSLVLGLQREFRNQGLELEPDPDFGSVGYDYFGFNVDAPEDGINYGFLQIIFEPEGWRAIVTQNEWGKKTMAALYQAVVREIKDQSLEEITINYAMYVSFIPYQADSPKPNTTD